MKKSHILMTNDDGISAEGIKHLWKSLKNHANLTIVAPAAEQSAVGLSITLRHPLHINPCHWPDDTPAWSINGTPSDCVKLGLGIIMDSKPDLVVSGINRGNNSGRNTLYSGTVAGAIEAVMHDIPGIAFSCYDYHQTDYSVAESYIPKIVEYVMKYPMPKGTLLNVNFPSKSHKKIKGLKLARQGQGYWMENPDKRHHPSEGHSYYWLGAKLYECEESSDSDVYWLERGYATAVPLHVGELTHHDHLAAHKSQFEGWFEDILRRD
jgi:5'-nucleotidase